MTCWVCWFADGELHRWEVRGEAEDELQEGIALVELVHGASGYWLEKPGDPVIG